MTKELSAVFDSFNIKTDIPILYIQGEEDHLFIKDVRNYVENRKTEILKVIPECGHLINLQSPAVFNQEASKFLLA